MNYLQLSSPFRVSPRSRSILVAITSSKANFLISERISSRDAWRDLRASKVRPEPVSGEGRQPPTTTNHSSLEEITVPTPEGVLGEVAELGAAWVMA
jgi:hypothetical protein